MKHKLKDKKFAFRICERDLNQIRRKAGAAKMTVTDYITACALGKDIVVVDGLPELAAQLKGIGRNLNQLTVLANMGRIEAAGLSDTKAQLAEIYIQLSAIMERIA